MVIGEGGAEKLASIRWVPPSAFQRAGQAPPPRPTSSREHTLGEPALLHVPSLSHLVETSHSWQESFEQAQSFASRREPASKRGGTDHADGTS
jgi:hypothetical protein